MGAEHEKVTESNLPFTLDPGIPSSHPPPPQTGTHCFWFVAYLYAYKNVLAGPVVELSIDLFLRIVECVLLNYVIAARKEKENLNHLNERDGKALK